MKLSYILENFVVITMSETAGFSLPQEKHGLIHIHFVVDGLEYDQYFYDQDVVLDRENGMRGSFVVIDEDGEACQFTALDSVDLISLENS